MLLWRFIRNRRAGVAPFFALTAIPVMGLIGAAVDYSRANSVQATLQAAADSTALAMAQDAAALTTSQLQTNATAYFNAIFNSPQVQNPTITVTYTTNNGSQVTANASANVPTLFMGLLGFSQMSVSASSTTSWSLSRLRVALVLDNTGSMSQNGKMSALKTAAQNLLTQLKDAARTPDDVYVSIIPFTTDVNIGTSYASAAWIDWSNYSPNGSIENGMKGCPGSGSGGSGGWGDWGGGSVQQCGQTNTNLWNGCVMDRTQNYDVSAAAATSGNTGTFFPADQSAWCPTQLMGLSNNWTALANEINAMQPNGDTNQTIGLAWGWQSLAGNTPLSAPAMDSNYQYQQVIILLTDGLNTQNRWTYTQSVIDAREQLACNNIKAAGITVYTVLVMSGDSAILQSCASDPSKYFALTNSNQIITTFNQIGTALAQLHLAK